MNANPNSKVNWQRYLQGRSVVFDGYISSYDMGEIKSDLSEFWALLLSQVIEAYADGRWEGILCTMWSDSGRFIAYPFSRDEMLKRNERVSVQVHVNLLEQEKWDLDYDPDSTEAEQQNFNRSYDKLTKKYWQLLVQALEIEPAKSIIDKLQHQRSFLMLGCEEEPINYEVFSLSSLR